MQDDSPFTLPNHWAYSLFFFPTFPPHSFSSFISGVFFSPFPSLLSDDKWTTTFLYPIYPSISSSLPILTLTSLCNPLSLVFLLPTHVFLFRPFSLPILCSSYGLSLSVSFPFTHHSTIIRCYIVVETLERGGDIGSRGCMAPGETYRGMGVPGGTG